MKKRLLLFSMVGSLLLSAAANSQTFELAKELLIEKNYELSAIEFRRFAMETDNEAEQAAAYLYSSYAYLQSNKGAISSEMLDRAEDSGNSSDVLNEHTLLSAETARAMNDTDTALYFYDVLATEPDQVAFQTFARRRAAAIHLSRGDPAAARRELKHSVSDEIRTIQALDEFTSGSDKSPMLGGLWGFIPGAGYWYSGEIANGLRSLILNSLFIYGMANTAENEQWGAFAIITFFEITWYSGSIYGGVDAAQRYNQNRLDTTLHAIEGNLSFQPKPEIVVPVFKLNIHF